MLRLAQHVAVILATLGGVALLWTLRGTCLVFALSFGVAAAVRPVMEFFQRRGLSRPAALAAAYLLSLGLLVVPTALAAGPFLTDLGRLGDDLVRAHDQWSKTADRDESWVLLASHLVSPARHWAQSSETPQAMTLAKEAFGVTFSLADLLIKGMIALALSVYWTLDREHFERLWLSLLPARERISARDVWRTMEAEFGAYCRSEISQSLAAGLLLATGFWLLGNPYPALLAVLGGLAWMIPWVGTMFAITAVAVATLPQLVFLGGQAAWTVMLPAAGYTLLVFLLLEVFVEPRLCSRRQYNTLVITAVTLALARSFGLGGLLLGPPLTITAQIILRRVLRQMVMTGAMPATIPDSQTWLDRVRALEQQVGTRQSLPNELVGLVHRLVALADESRPLLPGAKDQSGPFPKSVA